VRIYLEIISGNEMPPVMVLLRNLRTLVTVMFTAKKRICGLVDRIREDGALVGKGSEIAAEDGTGL